MSRIGKKPIDIPQGIEVKIEGQVVTAKVVEIDESKKRIELSIRELEERPVEEPKAEETEKPEEAKSTENTNETTLREAVELTDDAQTSILDDSNKAE